jgi:hypothetical protein
VIDKQVEAGVDVGNDGEQSRVGFQTYVYRCLCGFGGESRRPPSRDQIDFQSYARQTELRFPAVRDALLGNFKNVIVFRFVISALKYTIPTAREVRWRGFGTVQVCCHLTTISSPLTMFSSLLSTKFEVIISRIRQVIDGMGRWDDTL